MGCGAAGPAGPTTTLASGLTAMAILLVVLFLVVPVTEIYVIVQVGQIIGVFPTVVLLLAESALGAWLVKREGSRAWRALRGAFGSGRLPNVELANAALVLIGGTLLLTPGFVTDVVGFLLVIPVTRPFARRALGWVIARRAGKTLGRRTATSGRGSGSSGTARGPGTPGSLRGQRRGSPEVVRGEVVNDDDPPR